MIRSRPTRRLVLAGAAAAGIAGLAGCGAGDSSTGADATTGDSSSDGERPDDAAAGDTADDDTATGESTTDDATTTDAAPGIDHPDRVLLDEPFTLRLDGLPTDEAVDVRVETEDAGGRRWAATATVRTGDGRVDFDEATPVDVPWPDGLSVPNTMALLQFLAPVGEEPRYDPGLEETLRVTASVGDEELASTSLARLHGHPDVAVSDVEQGELAGSLHEPPGDEPAPGVVVLHASDGRLDEFLARMLAANGFAALALRYFGGEAPTDQLFEVPVGYVGTAIRWLLDRDRVAGERVGLVGDSKGGELALLAGSEYDAVGPVVSRNGSGVIWPGFGGAGFNAGSSWRVDGNSTAFVPYVEDPALWNTSGLEPAYTASLENASADRIAAATIPVERIDGPVLFVSGADDAVWDADRLQGIAAERLADRGRTDVEHLVYEDAGHLTTIPYRPVVDVEARTPLRVGGTPAGHAAASADYWPRVLETLRSLE
jgi:nucleolar protein 56